MQAKQIPIISNMRSSKDHLTVIEQQLAQSPNVIKDSYILPIPGDDDMGQQIIPINKSVPQHIFALRRKEDELKYAHNKSCVIYSSQEAFYPGGKEHPSTSVVGDIDKKGGNFDYIHRQNRARLPKRFYLVERHDKKHGTYYPDSLKLYRSCYIGTLEKGKNTARKKNMALHK